jgi:hypothetical protein
VNLRKFSRLKWLGLALVFVGFGLIPLTILAFAILRVPFDEYGVAVVYLMVPTGSSWPAGVGILILESRFAQRHTN